MAAPLFPGTNWFTAITIDGLYDNNTGSPLFAANGTTAPTSSLTVGGNDVNSLQQAILLDQSQNLLSFPGIQFKIGAAWTSATGAGTFQYNTGTATELPVLSGAPAYLVQLDQTTTITGGAVTFQGTYDNINWVTIPTSQVVNPNTFASLTNPYTLVASTNAAFLILAQGYAQIRLDLSTAITGTGSVTPYWSTLAYVPTSTTASEIVSGNLTNNNAAPISNNLGVLGFIAETAYNTVTYTTGNQVLAVTDLHGAINNDMQAIAGVQLGATGVVAFGSAPAAVNVQAVNAANFVMVAGTPTAVTGTGTSMNVNITNTTVPVAGTLTNNNAAPAANNVGALVAQAATTYTTVTYTNGDQVLLVTDLHGATNNDMQAIAGVQIGSTSVVNFGSAPAAAPVQAVNSSIFSGTTALTNTGGALNVEITGSTATLTVAGNLTNNNAAPAANNMGVLGFIATATPEAYTQGDQVLATTSLGGAVRTVPVDEANASLLSYYEVNNGSTTIATTTAFAPVLAFQSNSASFIYLVRMFQFMSGGQLTEFVVLKNPTVTGGTFVAASGHFNLNTTATSYTGGTKVLAGYASATPFLLTQLLDAVAAGAPGDTFAIQARTFTGTGTAVANVRWSEQAAAL